MIDHTRIRAAICSTLTLVLCSCKSPGDIQKSVAGGGAAGTAPDLALLDPVKSQVYSSDSIEVRGTCAAGYQVNLSGDDTQSMSCTTGAFTFKITKPSDGTYQFSVSQSKPGEKRVSQSKTFQWVRLSVAPAAPTVALPISATFTSNGYVSISGRCTAGFEINVGGDLTQSTTCDLNGSYTIVVTAPQDNTYRLNVSQKNPLGMVSANNPTLSWTKNSSLPTVSFTSTPGTIHLASTGGFAFTANNVTAFHCKLDSAPFSPCTSPYVFTGISNGMHTFTVKAIDSLGHDDPMPNSYSWSQEVYNTIALYHFNTSPGLTADSSLFTASIQNPLTNSGATSNSSAVFGQGAKFNSNSNHSMSSSNAGTTQALVSDTMTLEGFVNFTNLPSNGNSYAIVSKTGSSGQYGWEFGVTRSGSNYYMYFSGSLNGTSAPTLILSNSINPGSGSFHHYAVTWDHGDLNFFYDGYSMGNGSIGAKPVLLFSSTAPLTIGSGNNRNYINGTIDELRVSRIVRWANDFIAPSGAYTSD